jgi:hypothetical protein
MACIERRPRCGTPDSSLVPTPLSKIGSVIGIISAIAGAVGGVIKATDTVVGIATSLGAAGSGTIAGLAAGIAVIIIVGIYAFDRCVGTDGLQECVAGVVNEIVQDFSSALEEIFPFTAMHDRIDVVVKARYWDVVEDGNAKVLCTDEAPPRRSEILRCYYFTERVCNAAKGAQIGAGVGAAAGVVAAAAVGAAIGCATVILCIVALIVAALVAAAAALVGALIGGQIAKAVSDGDSPTAADGTEISVGDLITVNGNMVRREEDEGANVIWWVSTSSLSGRMPDSVASNPFSYCDVDDVFTMDSCPRVVD